MSNAKEQIRAWVAPETKAFLEHKAEETGRALSEVACQMLEERAIQIKTGEVSPWLSDMIDAVLARYFQGFPEVLRRLVTASFEAEGWGNAEFLKLLEIAGDKDPKSQDQRAAKLATNIQAFARQRADEFFQALAEPEEWIEPQEPAE